MTITDMVQKCMKDNTVEFFEQLLTYLLKSNDRSIFCASRQIVDTLVDSVLSLDSKIVAGSYLQLFIIISDDFFVFINCAYCLLHIVADESRAGNSESESSNLDAAAIHKEHQERLLACLTTLSAFSKVRPELLVNHAETLQPYLSMNASGTAEQQVLYQVYSAI